MSVLKAVNVKAGRNASLKGIINYVLKPEKTDERLITGVNCDVPEALETFMDTKQCFGKLKGRQYYHFVLAFPPNEKITAEQAHKVAFEFVERCKKFKGFEMIVVTHKDRNHIHTHFVMNSVSFADGHKFHITRKELADMKELQNQISMEMGFSAAPKKGFDMFGKKRTGVTANCSRTFQTLKKAESHQKDSFLMNCREAVLKSVRMANAKEQFIQLMNAQGFETEWKDNKKHITFTDRKLKQKGENKCKVRLSKLAQYFPELKDYKTKEDLQDGIERNKSIRIEPDNNRYSVTGNNPHKSKTRGIIDFNAEYEQYSAGIDRERAVQAAQENARRAAELAELARQEYEREEKERKRNDEQIQKRSAEHQNTDSYRNEINGSDRTAQVQQRTGGAVPSEPVQKRRTR